MPAPQPFAGPLAAALPQFGPGDTAQLLAEPADCLPVPSANDRRAWAPDALPAEFLRDLRQRADAELRTPWPLPLAHAYVRYFRDGDRTAWWRWRGRRRRRGIGIAAGADQRRRDDEARADRKRAGHVSVLPSPLHHDKLRRRGGAMFMP